MHFVADSMLGRLARWLRVMGHDVLYHGHWDIDALMRLSSERRIILSRKTNLLKEDLSLIVLHSDRVREQLLELDARVGLKQDPSERFSRCIECNAPLEKADPDGWGKGLPEYVFYSMRESIRRCPGCGRFFWPGSHRKKMEEQLKAWGF